MSPAFSWPGASTYWKILSPPIGYWLLSLGSHSILTARGTLKKLGDRVTMVSRQHRPSQSLCSCWRPQTCHHSSHLWARIRERVPACLLHTVWSELAALEGSEQLSLPPMWLGLEPFLGRQGGIGEWWGPGRQEGSRELPVPQLCRFLFTGGNLKICSAYSEGKHSCTWQSVLFYLRCWELSSPSNNYFIWSIGPLQKFFEKCVENVNLLFCGWKPRRCCWVLLCELHQSVSGLAE